MPGRVGGCLVGWVHKGVSEGVIKWVAWFGGLGVCSPVRGMSIGFSPFFSVHFSPWDFLRGFWGEAQGYGSG